ncbi:MAG: MFS transporter, partial [Candidatus Cybelea sp.]
MAFFDRSNAMAKPGFNRWLVPPAALCIHLCIGEVYAFSVFTKPMAQAIGITAPKSGADWTVPQLGWIFSLAILILGLSAAFGGKWVERAGPRKAMFVAASCFSSGLILAGIGVSAHLLWLVYLGYGVVGGCGLGIGYISPVSTLIKWFPDRPGLATGTAIMGFGGGAMIGAPLSVLLMKHFANASGTGVAQTMFVLGVLYFIWMIVGSLIVRIPQEGWKPDGYVAPVTSQAMITSKNVVLEHALRTPQFYL